MNYFNIYFEEIGTFYLILVVIISSHYFKKSIIHETILEVFTFLEVKGESFSDRARTTTSAENIFIKKYDGALRLGGILMWLLVFPILMENHNLLESFVIIGLMLLFIYLIGTYKSSRSKEYIRDLRKKYMHANPGFFKIYSNYYGQSLPSAKNLGEKIRSHPVAHMIISMQIVESSSNLKTLMPRLESQDRMLKKDALQTIHNPDRSNYANEKIKNDFQIPFYIRTNSSAENPIITERTLGLEYFQFQREFLRFYGLQYSLKWEYLDSELIWNDDNSYVERVVIKTTEITDYNINVFNEEFFFLETR